MPRLPVDPDREHLSDADVDTLLAIEDGDAGPEPGPGIRGGSVIVSPAEGRRRREIMSRMLASGASEDAVLEAFTRPTLSDGSPGFAMSEIRVRALISEVRAAWSDEDNASKKYNKAAAIRRHLQHIPKAAAKGQWSAVAMLEKNLASIQGTASAIKVDIGGSARLSEAVLAVLGEADPVEIRRLVDEETQLLRAGSKPPAAAIQATVVKRPPEALSRERVQAARQALDAFGDIDE